MNDPARELRPEHGVRRRDLVGGLVAGTVLGAGGATIVDKATRHDDGAAASGGPQLDLRSFGAKGDGNTDDADAVSAWLEAALRTGTAAYAPPGEYRLERQVQVDVTGRTLTMIGAGSPTSTTFLVPSGNDQGAIALKSAAPVDGQIVVRDLAFRSEGKGTGTALSFLAPSENGAQYIRSVTLQNLVISGADGKSHSFDVGVHIRGAWRAMLDSLLVSGPRDASVAGDYTDRSPIFTGSTGIKLDNSYGWTVQNCSVWSFTTAIEDVGTNGEGGYVHNAILVGCKTGFHYSRKSREPGLVIADTHVNARDTGIDIDGCQLGVIQNCLIYNENGPNPRQPTKRPEGSIPARDIRLRNIHNVDVRGNRFHFIGNPARTHIDVDASQFAEDIRIEGNVFSGGSQASAVDSAVAVGGGARRISLIDNAFPGVYRVQIADSSRLATGTTTAPEERAGDTAMVLSIKGPAGTSFQRVSVGPPHSAGPGFRSLRVANDI